MSHNSHTNHLFNSTECLSEQQMLDYIDNKLSLQERHMVEKHVLDCELCADALEGFSLITNREKLDDVAFAVNTMVQGGEKKEERKLGWWNARMKIAASVAVLLLIGSIAIYLKNSVQKEADKTFAAHFEPFPGKDATGNTKGKETQQQEQTGEGIDALAQDKVTETNEKQLENPVPVNKQQYAANIESQKNAAPVMVQDESKKAALKEEEAPAEDIAYYKNGEGEKDMDNKVTGNTNVTANNTSSYGYISADSTSTAITMSGTATAPSQTQDMSVSSYTYSPQSKTTSPSYLKLSELAKPKKNDGEGLALKKTKNKSSAAPGTMSTSTNDYAYDDQKKEQFKVAQDAEANNNRVSTKAEEKTKAEGPADKKDNAPVTPLSRAMEKYNTGKYAEALPLFEQALAAEPSNIEALFYSAVSYLSTNQPDKALTNLNKVLALNNAAYNDPAKWYKALAFIKKGDKKSAKPLLEQLRNGNSSYKQKAADTLKDLN